MTTTVSDPNKRNACIMGRKTYFGIPPSKRPLANRLNIVLTKNPKADEYPETVIVCESFDSALKKLRQDPVNETIENLWIVGGFSVYEEAMNHPDCHRVYLTEIKAKYECDAFFPTIPNDFQLVPNDNGIPSDEQIENNIRYQYKIYEKK